MKTFEGMVVDVASAILTYTGPLKTGAEVNVKLTDIAKRSGLTKREVKSVIATNGFGYLVGSHTPILKSTSRYTTFDTVTLKGRNVTYT